MKNCNNAVQKTAPAVISMEFGIAIEAFELVFSKSLQHLKDI